MGPVCLNNLLQRVALQIRSPAFCRFREGSYCVTATDALSFSAGGMIFSGFMGEGQPLEPGVIIRREFDGVAVAGRAFEDGDNASELMRSFSSSNPW